MDEWLRRLRFYFRRSEFESELEEELQHHRALSGERRFGNITLVQEDSRAAWQWRWLEEMGQDLRYAFRAMAVNRPFTALAVLSLALGIGANTAIFSFLDTLLLRPITARDPDSLITLQWHTQKWPEFKASGNGVWYRDSGGLSGVNLPFSAYEIFRAQDRYFSSVIGFSSAGADELNVLANGEARMTAGQRVSGNFFSTLGVQPAAGRLIQPEDDQADAPLVAVISHAMWMSRFGGSKDAIGQRVRINNHFVTIVGVVPPGFRGPGFLFEKGRDLYLPLHTPALVEQTLAAASQDPRFIDPQNYWVEVLARLNPGVSADQAAHALEPMFQRFVQEAEGGKQIVLPSLIAKPGGRGYVGLQLSYGEQVWILFALVSLILIIACANVANLLLARGMTRQRELAVRLSIGASRGRVIRQLLTEAVLLSALGGAGGIVVAVGTMRYLTTKLAAERANFLLTPDLNWRVLGIAAAVSVASGILFGLIPALRATRIDVYPALKESRTAATPSRWRVNFGQLLVSGQMAMAVVLLVAAALFVGTLVKLNAQNLGFDARNLLLVRIESKTAGYSNNPLRLQLYDGLREKFAALPGVRSVSEAEIGMLKGMRRVSRSMTIRIPGREAPPNVTTFADGVGPRYLSTVGMPLLVGREIDERDTATGVRVAVVNRQFVDTFFGGENPLGQHFQYIFKERFDAEQSETTDYEIIGVVGDVRAYSLKESIAFLWLPYKADTRMSGEMTFAIRADGNPLLLSDAVRKIVQETDERLPLTISTQEHEIDLSTREEQMFATLAGGLAGLGLMIACVGLYGTVAYSVARRTNEIGIRMALGAQRGRVVWMVVRQVLWMMVAGITLGIPAALTGSKLVTSYLFGLKANDPAVLIGAVTALLTCAAIAALVPAQRAARINPLSALRQE